MNLQTDTEHDYTPAPQPIRAKTRRSCWRKTDIKNALSVSHASRLPTYKSTAVVVKCNAVSFSAQNDNACCPMSHQVQPCTAVSMFSTFTYSSTRYRYSSSAAQHHAHLLIKLRVRHAPRGREPSHKAPGVRPHVYPLQPAVDFTVAPACSRTAHTNRRKCAVWLCMMHHAVQARKKKSRRQNREGKNNADRLYLPIPSKTPTRVGDGLGWWMQGEVRPLENVCSRASRIRGYLLPRICRRCCRTTSTTARRLNRRSHFPKHGTVVPQHCCLD